MKDPHAAHERRSSPRFTEAQLDVYVRADWLHNRAIKVVNSSRAGVLLCLNGQVPDEQFTGIGELWCGSTMCTCAFRVTRVHVSTDANYVGLAVSPNQTSRGAYDGIFPPTPGAGPEAATPALRLAVTRHYIRWVVGLLVALVPVLTYSLPILRWLLGIIRQHPPVRLPILPFLGATISIGAAMLVLTFAAKLSVDLWRGRISVAPSSRLVRLVLQTENALNRSLVERGVLGYGLCYLVYWLGGFLNGPYRSAFTSLRVQRLFSSRRYGRVVRLTSNNAEGYLLYLRILALTRTDRLQEATALLDGAIERDQHNPYLHLASAQVSLERSGFYSHEYRHAVQRAYFLANAKLAEDGNLYVCPDAIAEQAKVAAFDIAIGLPEHSEGGGRRRRFDGTIVRVQEARRLAERYSVRLASEIRGVEGVIQGLAGEFPEAYRLFMDALFTGENLKARYYLAVLLMVGSASFLRPIYHFERILRLVPKRSRLARLARARLDEALAIANRNQELTTSWTSFRLLTFDRRYLELAESEQPAWIALAYREDERKREAFKAVFGSDALVSEATPDWAREVWENLRISSRSEIANEEIKREVNVRVMKF